LGANVDQNNPGSGIYRTFKGPPPSVNLVIAATQSEDYSWVEELQVPGMNIIPYIADNISAPHHTQKNKGHEAMIYHQYFYDFYDNLPEISILIHSSDRSWHVEELLDTSMLFSINHLDMREVQRRQFLNLRVTWGTGCSSGSINTSRYMDENPSAGEEKEMRETFQANFNIYDIPQILATPCCSQIAVTKERILSVPRDQYAHHIDWLLETKLDDNLSGRTWEHMWQYLFLHKAIDCPLEHRAYCTLYHICFGGREQYDEWIELMQGKDKLNKELQTIKERDDEAESRMRNEASEGKKSGERQHRKDRESRKDAEERKKLEEEEEAKKNGKEKELEEKKKEEEKLNKEKQERDILRRWLETELSNIEEAIRVRKEIAIVRGAVEANRIVEGENLYGDDMELSVEKVIGLPVLASTTSISTSM
jgi:hypothetical protein